MARFEFTEDGDLIANEHGDVEYDEAIDAIVERAVSMIEEALWNMVDDLEYVIAEETVEPSDDVVVEDDDAE